MIVEQHSHLRHVNDVLRSGHYTWLSEGLAGEPIDVAMTRLTANIMHVCDRAGVSWDEVVQRAHEQFETDLEQTFESSGASLGIKRPK